MVWLTKKQWNMLMHCYLMQEDNKDISMPPLDKCNYSRERKHSMYASSVNEH